MQKYPSTKVKKSINGILWPSIEHFFIISIKFNLSCSTVTYEDPYRIDRRVIFLPSLSD